VQKAIVIRTRGVASLKTEVSLTAAVSNSDFMIRDLLPSTKGTRIILKGFLQETLFALLLRKNISITTDKQSRQHKWNYHSSGHYPSY
jgi:hypothetical protein